MIRGVKLASIPVKDQDKALAFYRDRLGFKAIVDQTYGGQRWIELGIPGADTRVVLSAISGEQEHKGSIQPITFWTDDVQATYEELRAKAVEFVQPPQKEHWGTSAVFKDPDGNQFVLASR